MLGSASFIKKKKKNGRPDKLYIWKRLNHNISIETLKKMMILVWLDVGAENFSSWPRMYLKKYLMLDDMAMLFTNPLHNSWG